MTFEQWWSSKCEVGYFDTKALAKEAYETGAKSERESCKKENEFLIRLVSAVTTSEFGGVSCFDIEGHGNRFDVRDMILRSN